MKISEMTQTILSKHEQNTYPIDVEEIAKKEGIAVLYTKFEKATLSGILLYQNGQHFIGINKDNNPERQRFSIAHELGHYFLHKSTLDVDNIQNEQILFRLENNAGIDEKERAANEFAANLLMPENLFKTVHKEKNGSILELAKAFNVSQKAAEYRCINLKLEVAR